MAVLTMLLTGCASTPAASGAGGDAAEAPPSGPLPSGVTQAMVTAGRQLYTGPADCSTCHGSDGRGTPLGPNLTDSQWLNIDGTYDSIVRVITTGVQTPKQFSQGMPPKGGSNITDEQVRSVAAYVYSISVRPMDPLNPTLQAMQSLVDDARANPRKYFRIF
jgi:mono/diheme cytochrome c family protein